MFERVNDPYYRYFSICCGRLPGDNCDFRTGDCTWTGSGDQDRQCCDDNTPFVAAFVGSDVGYYYRIRVYDPAGNEVAVCEPAGRYMPCIAGSRNLVFVFSVEALTANQRGWLITISLNDPFGEKQPLWRVWFPGWQSIRMSIPVALSPASLTFAISAGTGGDIAVRLHSMGLVIDGQVVPATSMMIRRRLCWVPDPILNNTNSRIAVIGLPGIPRTVFEQLYP